MASWTEGKAKTSGGARVVSNGPKQTINASSKGTTLSSSQTKTASVRTPLASPSAKVSATPSPQPTATPTAPATRTTNSDNAFAGVSAPFFSAQGQLQRLRNVVETYKVVLNPFSRDRISATTGSINANKVLEAVANHPFITAGVAAGGITAVRYAPSAFAAMRSPAASTVVTNAARSSSLRVPAIAAGIGLAAGALFMRNPAAPQETTQRGEQSGTSTPSQRSEVYDYSQRQTYQDQYATNTIIGSPGARIGASQGQVADLPSTFTQSPSQSAPFGQDLGQSASQSQGSDFLLPALIIGAAFLLTSR